jgi:acetyl-CoA carboxylase biotin carboxyl carrier protein
VSISWDEALERVRQAVALCVEGDLERLRVEEEAFSLEVRRTPRPAPGVQISQAASPSEAWEPGHHGAQASMGNGAVRAATESIMLKADFVGILRFSRPIITEGSVVSEDRELAYVESLGTRNPVRAAGRGTITAVHVTDGQAVDYGHPLFAVAYE